MLPKGCRRQAEGVHQTSEEPLHDRHTDYYLVKILKFVFGQVPSFGFFFVLLSSSFHCGLTVVVGGGA